jgi:hypothetical protein
LNLGRVLKISQFATALATFSLVIALTACSPQVAESPSLEPTPEPTESESAAPLVNTLLSISQRWVGNSVALSILDSAGVSCDSPEPSEECQGFYIGWRANFNDEDRNVEYTLNRETIISDLQIGDEGEFLLMYQEVPGSEDSISNVIKEFSFSYGY